MPTERPLQVHLIARDNGAGLSRDLALVRDTLAAAADMHVSVTAIGHRSGLRKRMQQLGRHLRDRWPQPRRLRYDINVMLEHVRPEYLPYARHNVLVPNPEWFDPAWESHLSRFDAVLAKTGHAERLFAALGARTRRIGFTSNDRLQTQVPRQRAFVHLPGRSGNKGTLALIELWRAHPEWPMLTVAWRRKRVDPGPLPANVTLRRDYLDEATLATLQNGCLFHLCPSRTEGFGHSLVEALGVGAVVVTLDAEPMNELVTRERGLLVAARAGGRQALATLYDFEPTAMVTAVQACLQMDAATLATLSQHARAWFEANDRDFRQQLPQALREIAAPRGELA